MIAEINSAKLDRERRVTPVRVIATIGAALAIIQLYFLVKWITSPNFTAVTSGPSVPAMWMQISVRTVEIVSTGVAVWMVYYFVIRPWRREQRVPYDGLVVLSALAVSMYDPLNSYFHTWFAYNSFFFNHGTAVLGIPGWQSFNEPGAQIAWPIFFIPPLYAVMFLGIPMFGCWVMRKAKAKWFALPNIALVLIALVLIAAIDIALEGPVVMRLGFYDHTGPSIPFLDSYYGHNSIPNIILVTAAVTLATGLRYFRNDRGETLVERGSYRMGSTRLKTTIVRFFAIFAAIQAILFAGYHAPMAVWTLLHPDARWRSNMVDNSYLNDHICGYATPRICPGN
jgi:hypothetical protein